MKDAFERRALLLHFADVLEAVNWLIQNDDSHKTVRELAATNEPLARFPLLGQVSAHMTSTEFVRCATRAFVEWPRELLEFELDRKRLASTVQLNLFARNADGWRAYVAGLTDEVSWFGVGLPLLSADEDVHASSTEADAGSPSANEKEAEAAVASEAPHNGEQIEQDRESVETSERIYPTWPWKSGV
ncbi:hypothetical protein VOM14_27245 [Paraburkholderia sp. MPAMCS5]|uniref:hypothetical protein n=1 Tax=Paraburkholderia sp. MPAMCS5 TaxID=3112563 RepID=UPI002E18CF4C|nr:hypothetical protein [Paraburkholderia sp. MPAMCS5]